MEKTRGSSAGKYPKHCFDPRDICGMEGDDSHYGLSELSMSILKILPFNLYGEGYNKDEIGLIIKKVKEISDKNIQESLIELDCRKLVNFSHCGSWIKTTLGVDVLARIKKENTDRKSQKFWALFLIVFTAIVSGLVGIVSAYVQKYWI